MEHTPDDDVLEPFAEEWTERARRAQEALNAMLAHNGPTPRIERVTRRDRAAQHVLVRAERGDDLRGHAVTVKFTEHEWALIRAVVLATHGLRATDEGAQ